MREEWTGQEAEAGRAGRVSTRLIAFYLPQFHPIPENDAWWGRGFTEWTNVTRARPVFPGHQQPRRPADLGYYDLRVPEVREQQAFLAREYGIHGFCYHYYWFDGRRLLERPFEEMLASGRPDLPFCVCWANENWTRRWDGDEHEVLVGQEHSPESDRRFILDLVPVLRDPRYIRFEGKPVIVVYRAGLLPDAPRTTGIWRERCAEQGIPELHLVAAQSFGLEDPRPLGFDAAVEFPPHAIRANPITHEIAGLDPGFHGKIYDYRDAVEFGIARPPEPYLLHRGVMVPWDNTARRGPGAHVWHHGSPEAYERWLRAMVASASAGPSARDPLVFINAWNEWAEGAYLEPDEHHGHGYLQATRRALIAGQGAPTGARQPPRRGPADPERLREYVLELEDRIERYERANRYLCAELEARDARDDTELVAFTPDAPEWIPDDELAVEGSLRMERLGPLDESGELATGRGRRMRMSGSAWTELSPDRAALVLRSTQGQPIYFAPVRLRSHCHAPIAPSGQSRAAPAIHGFSVLADYEAVEPGDYALGVVQGAGERVAVTLSNLRVRVPALP